MKFNKKYLKQAESFLNYSHIDFFEQAGINLLAVLLDKYGAEELHLENINLTELVSDEKYSTVLKEFIEPLEDEAFSQLRDMIFDVKCFIIKHKTKYITDSDYSFLGINNKSEDFIDFNDDLKEKF